MSRQRFRNVLVLTGDPSLQDPSKPGSRYSEYDLRYYDAMRAALWSLGQYRFEFFNDHSRLLERLLSEPPEFVLNFCDTGFRNVPEHELHVPALLEMLGIPYSGAAPAGMVMCYDKAIVALVSKDLGIPVPAEIYVGAGAKQDILNGFDYPGLIKPNRADGSIGITRDAVVADARQAQAHVAEVRKQLPGCDVLVQEYLPGPEYGLALIGNPGSGFEVFPPLTVDFSGLPEGWPPILGYESKTDPSSPYWTGTHIQPAKLDDDTYAELTGASKRLFERLQCRDYARFDFRAAADGTIKLMEVNPNPAWDFEAKLALMAGFAGKAYSELLEMILEAAQVRIVARE
jgi:D-alanine-D-alanine ligase